MRPFNKTDFNSYNSIFDFIPNSTEKEIVYIKLKSGLLRHIYHLSEIKHLISIRCRFCGYLPSIIDESSKDKEGSAGEDDDPNDRVANC